MDRELSALCSALEQQRRHVLGALDGLTADQLHQAVLPSGWSCLGLVRHLAVDVEEFWFQSVVAGKAFDGDEFGEDLIAAWRVPVGTDPNVVVDRYRREIARANAVIEARSPDSEPEGWPIDRWPDKHLPDLRAVILHVITETACHAGHLDAAAELLDGRQWVAITQ